MLIFVKSTPVKHQNRHQIHSVAIFALKSFAVGHLSSRKGSIRSRGSFIITQKENKGEYHGIHCGNATGCSGGYIDNGSTWYWNNTIYDWDIYAHVFDQNGKNGDTSNIPIRYANSSTNYYNTNNIPQCTNDFDAPSDLLDRAQGLYGNNQKKIDNQYSCKPYLSNPGLNAGNYYNSPAATAGSIGNSVVSKSNLPNSICPKGWQLPSYDGDKSYNTLIRTAYGISGSDTASGANLLNNPAMSFVRLGHYDYNYGSLVNRGNEGYYWSSAVHSSVLNFYLNFNSSKLYTQNGYNRAAGFSIRCVSR